MLLKYEEMKKKFLEESRNTFKKPETELQKQKPGWHADFSDPGTFPKHIIISGDSCDGFVRVIDDIEKRNKERAEKRIASAIKNNQEPEKYRPLSRIARRKALEDLILTSQGIKIVGACEGNALLHKVNLSKKFRKIPTEDLRVMLLLDKDDNIRAILEYKSNGTPTTEATITFKRRLEIEQSCGRRLSDEKVSFVIIDNGKIVHEVSSAKIKGDNYMELVCQTRDEAENWLIHDYPKVLGIEGDFSKWKNLNAYRYR